jgi:two-component system cell cycle sensor histidine kinase/response regulator CckA
VLLVEDDDGVRRLARAALERGGYRVVEARHGEEALAVLEREAGPIHLLFTDVVMPRMGGCELAGRVGALRPDVRVLYISGYTEDAIMHRGVLDAGAAFLEKPFSPQALVRKACEVLDGATSVSAAGKP